MSSLVCSLTCLTRVSMFSLHSDIEPITFPTSSSCLKIEKKITKKLKQSNFKIFYVFNILECEQKLFVKYKTSVLDVSSQVSPRTNAILGEIARECLE